MVMLKSSAVLAATLLAAIATATATIATYKTWFMLFVSDLMLFVALEALMNGGLRKDK